MPFGTTTRLVPTDHVCGVGATRPPGDYDGMICHYCISLSAMLSTNNPKPLDKSIYLLHMHNQSETRHSRERIRIESTQMIFLKIILGRRDGWMQLAVVSN